MRNSMNFWSGGRKEFARYVDACVRWEGRVASLIEADPNVPDLKIWVIPIEGEFDYCGSTILKIELTSPARNDAYASHTPLTLCDYLYSHGFVDIRRGDIVSFSGRILGISKKPDPASGPTCRFPHDSANVIQRTELRS